MAQKGRQNRSTGAGGESRIRFKTAVLLAANVFVFLLGLYFVRDTLVREQTSAQSGWFHAGTLSTAAEDREEHELLLDLFHSIKAREYYAVREYLRDAAGKSGEFRSYFAGLLNYISNAHSADPLEVPSPPQRLLSAHHVLPELPEFGVLQSEETARLGYVIPYAAFREYYVARARGGYSKRGELEGARDHEVESYARGFIQQFGSHGIPFEELSRIMALELELMYRQGRETAFWNRNQEWKRHVMSDVYRRIREYQQRFSWSFQYEQTGAVRGILGLKRVVESDVSAGAEVDPLSWEERRLGQIPGLRD